MFCECDVSKVSLEGKLCCRDPIGLQGRAVQTAGSVMVAVALSSSLEAEAIHLNAATLVSAVSEIISSCPCLFRRVR